MTKRGASTLALAVALFAPRAHADTPPTIWDLAKNPNAYEQRARHLQIERDIDLVDQLVEDPQEVAVRARKEALEDIQLVLARVTPRGRAPVPMDVWLRFDQAWLFMHRELSAAAVPILEGVAQELGAQPFGQLVWEKLAEAYVRVERTRDEIHAYDEVLARATSDTDRVTPLLNQGEAYMRAGDAEAAVAQFRDVLHLTATIPNANDIDMLAQWDLAVALDRAGSPREAIEAARSAVRMDRRCVAVVGSRLMMLPHPDPNITFYIVPAGLFSISKENKSVYFVPDYERDWYLALGYDAIALEEDSAPRSLGPFRDAETHMMSYVSAATLHGGDKWLDLGKKRLDEIRRRRAEAQKRAAASPRDPSVTLPL